MMKFIKKLVCKNYTPIERDGFILSDFQDYKNKENMKLQRIVRKLENENYLLNEKIEYIPTTYFNIGCFCENFFSQCFVTTSVKEMIDKETLFKAIEYIINSNIASLEELEKIEPMSIIEYANCLFSCKDVVAKIYYTLGDEICEFSSIDGFIKEYKNSIFNTGVNFGKHSLILNNAILIKQVDDIIIGECGEDNEKTILDYK